jgi:hypothetical protein
MIQGDVLLLCISSLMFARPVPMQNGRDCLDTGVTHTSVCSKQSTYCGTNYGISCVTCVGGDVVNGDVYDCMPVPDQNCTVYTNNCGSCGQQYTGYCVDPLPGGLWGCQSSYTSAFCAATCDYCIP